MAYTHPIVLLSRRKARVEIQKMFPHDLYTGKNLYNMKWTLEHIVPKSRMSMEGKRENLHNLGGIEFILNCTRGNKKFGDPLKNYKVYSGCKISKNLFSPMVGKGEVARTCAYMIETYQGSIDSKNLISNHTMEKWNDQFPPGDNEKRRNEIIYNIQGTYNRFVEDSKSLQEIIKPESTKIPIKYINHASKCVKDNQVSQDCTKDNGMVRIQKKESNSFRGINYYSTGEGIQTDLRGEGWASRVDY